MHRDCKSLRALQCQNQSPHIPDASFLNKRYDVSLTNISGILTFMSWLNGLSITINSLNTSAPAYTENETHLGTHRVITLERKDEKHRQLSDSGKTSLLCLQSIHKQWARVSGRGAGGASQHVLSVLQNDISLCWTETKFFRVWSYIWFLEVLAGKCSAISCARGFNKPLSGKQFLTLGDTYRSRGRSLSPLRARRRTVAWVRKLIQSSNTRFTAWSFYCSSIAQE